MKTSGRASILTDAATVTHRAKGLLSLMLITLLLPACNGQRSTDPGGGEGVVSANAATLPAVHLVALYCYTVNDPLVSTLGIDTDPDTIRVSPGDYIVFIAKNESVTLDFNPRTLTADTLPLALKPFDFARGEAGFDAISATMRVKPDAAKQKYELLFTDVQGPRCEHVDGPDHPPIIVNGP